MHRIFVTASHRVTWFSPKCLLLGTHFKYCKILQLNILRCVYDDFIFAIRIKQVVRLGRHHNMPPPHLDF